MPVENTPYACTAREDTEFCARKYIWERTGIGNRGCIVRYSTHTRVRLCLCRVDIECCCIASLEQESGTDEVPAVGAAEFAFQISRGAT